MIGKYNCTLVYVHLCCMIIVCMVVRDDSPIQNVSKMHDLIMLKNKGTHPDVQCGGTLL